MTIDTIRYPAPVTVNGYSCANANDVVQATRHVDPAHPRSGIDDISAQDDPTRSEADKAHIARQHAASVPAYRADGSHGSGADVSGLVFDKAA